MFLDYKLTTYATISNAQTSLVHFQITMYDGNYAGIINNIV